MSEEKTSKKVSIWAYILIGAAGLGILMFDIPNIGQSGSQTIAKIGDRDISLPELNNAVSRLQSQLPDLPPETLQRQALHHLTRQALLEQHALDSNFTYPDAELHNELKREFGNDEAYQTWLRQRNISAAAYQESLRRSGTIGLYYQTLAATAPKEDILFTALLDDLAQTHDYTAVRLPLAPAAQALPSDENAIKAWYDAHPDAFMTPEKVSVRYLILDRAKLADASAISEEALAAKQRANERRAGQYLIFDERSAADSAAAAIAAGDKTFADLAADIRSGKIAGETGDLPLQQHGKGIDPVVDDALFALAENGDISPVLSSANFNAMLLTLTERQQSDGDARSQLATTLLVVLALILTLTVLITLWLGILFGEHMTRPLRKLILATRKVADGNFSSRVSGMPKNDLGKLGEHFNTMTQALSDAEETAGSAQRALTEQKAYLETIMDNLTAGVITFNYRQELQTFNVSASNILNTPLTARLNQPLPDGDDIRDGYEELMLALREPLTAHHANWQQEVTLSRFGQRKVLMCHGSHLIEAGKRVRGGQVIVFDDITEFLHNQRNAAWEEVAKRLAHEIKNPLTPIRLQSERLQRKLSDKLEQSADRDLLAKATTTIIDQVETMRSLVSEFGIFARPLAMAFAIASGLKPEAGLFTAIIAGFLISLFSGSRVQIGGPAGAFIVIVYGIVQQYGVSGLLLATLMSGAMLWIMGMLRMGVLIKFIPVAVIIGFTNGIAVLIALSQVKDFLGLDIKEVPAEFFALVKTLWQGLPGWNGQAVSVSLFALAIIDGWLAAWAAERNTDEGFGDFAVRSGIIKPVINAPLDFWDADKIAV